LPFDLLILFSFRFHLRPIGLLGGTGVRVFGWGKALPPHDIDGVLSVRDPFGCGGIS